jgi:hypothetical protein
MFLPNLNILLEFAESPYSFFKKRTGLSVDWMPPTVLTVSALSASSDVTDKTYVRALLSVFFTFSAVFTTTPARFAL